MAFDVRSPCAPWLLVRAAGNRLPPLRLNGSPCARTIGSYPTPLCYCTVCGGIRSPTLEGRAAAPLGILGQGEVGAWVVGIGLHTCPDQTESGCHQVQGCHGLSVGIGPHMVHHSALLWHCAAAYLGGGKVATEMSGPHRCPTQVGGAS